MKKNRFYKFLVLPLILIIFSIYVVIFIRVVIEPKLEIGDTIDVKETLPTINLDIIDVDTLNLYLFDELNNAIIVYDDHGELISIYEFTYCASIAVIDIDEANETIKVYYYRIHVYYTIDFSGKIIDIEVDDKPRPDDKLDILNTNGSYEIKNRFFWYDIYKDSVLEIRRLSILPIIIGSILIFIGGMLFSIRQIKVDQKNKQT